MATILFLKFLQLWPPEAICLIAEELRFRLKTAKNLDYIIRILLQVCNYEMNNHFIKG